MIATIPGAKHKENILSLLQFPPGTKAAAVPSKPLDLSPEGLEPLSESQASIYRAATGSAIYLSLDDRVIQYATKELETLGFATFKL